MLGQVVGVAERGQCYSVESPTLATSATSLDLCLEAILVKLCRMWATFGALSCSIGGAIHPMGNQQELM